MSLAGLNDGSLLRSFGIIFKEKRIKMSKIKFNESTEWENRQEIIKIVGNKEALEVLRDLLNVVLSDNIDEASSKISSDKYGIDHIKIGVERNELTNSY